MLLADLAPDLLADPAAGRIAIDGLTADSRKAGPGVLFAGLPGVKVDGAAFAAAAVKAGSPAVLVGADAVVPADLGVPVLRDADPRRRLALMAARLHAPQPEVAVAVTGTAGKTSVAAFTRQIFEAAGRTAASVGTLGIVTAAGTRYGSLTTPDPITLHADLAALARDGVTHVAMEASSHGIEQRRLDGVVFRAAAFTNLGRDHMDYHATPADYLAAKLRLFETLLPDGGAAVIDPDAPAAWRVAEVVRRRGLRLFTVGADGKDLRLVSVTPDGTAQRLVIEASDGRHEVRLPLLGDFQVTNALIAAGLAIVAGVAPAAAIAALAGLEGAPGRLDLVGRTAEGAPVFVDYAHKPDALEAVLTTLRPVVSGRLVVVVGAGGDRDRGKRPLMGAIAVRCADVAIITDDNPRSEEPATIRAEILAAAPGAIEIGDRAEAIRHAVAMLGPNDALVVAGKGHETGQIVGSTVLPFSDHEEVAKALAAHGPATGATA
ncbi:UDP-N-acetylmuramoyl-L-alanyl-D-glutamate--2,6-diaminopimelate ligase [Segnochrobactrum spirostomi]|uniref:UDP-N-acetylmuramoyl-L-alanyl-D-glutamate--2,6-diaminopimelate ligase n=1 Tax=Segnochrobactrum spirostomi TaxID=2608987 RepID=A0A6A7Y4W3_9HYPH|nr:UDP-N-acetylmuramoyl-L-alanyl-D-glutamate--2,6-diaminopimelate ligase [Segnochrobactrum spirostomi]MQT13786.1 UDP-N-acetylmuramoyl-L-alanyl-D-glutamate--2,6-diaminopimelate ligase [Segnochrobactrum spirostomi]